MPTPFRISSVRNLVINLSNQKYTIAYSVQTQLFRMIYFHYQVDRKNKVIFFFYFHSKPGDGCILSETCSWLYLINRSFILTSVLYFWFYCEHRGDESTLESLYHLTIRIRSW